MCSEELDYWSWIAKVTEKLTFMRLKAINRKDIGEDDSALLKVLFPIWYNQEYPLYVTKMDGVSQSVTQTNLFNAISSVTGMNNFDGTLLDGLENEPNFENNETIS